MIFWLIARFRRSGSRFSGQKAVPGPKKEKNEQEMNKLWVIKKIIKISKKYFGPGSPKKRFLLFFRNLFTKKWDVNLGITSETTWESRVKRTGNLE